MSQDFGSPTTTTGGASETAVSIKTKYESNENTNVFTDADKQKLDGLSDITAATDISSFAAAFNAALVAPTPEV